MKRSIFIWSAIGLGGLGIAALSIPVSARVEERKEMAHNPYRDWTCPPIPASRPTSRWICCSFITHAAANCSPPLARPWAKTVSWNRTQTAATFGLCWNRTLTAFMKRLMVLALGRKLMCSTGCLNSVIGWMKFCGAIARMFSTPMVDATRWSCSNRVFRTTRFAAKARRRATPEGPDLTVWNAKAAYSALLEEFRKKPDVLFVCLTAPPLAPGKDAMPLWRRLAQKAKGMVRGNEFDRAESARLARQFNNWLCATDGWLKDYDLKNVVVFDYYDILTDNGASDLSRYATSGGANSHPSREGNEKAAQALVPFLNQSVRRALAGTGPCQCPVKARSHPANSSL